MQDLRWERRVDQPPAPEATISTYRPNYLEEIIRALVGFSPYELPHQPRVKTAMDLINLASNFASPTIIAPMLGALTKQQMLSAISKSGAKAAVEKYSETIPKTINLIKSKLSIAEISPKGKPITVYRGYQSGQTPTEANLTRVQQPLEFLAKMRGESVPKTQFLPFEYYTESKDVAKMYANQDEFLIQKIIRGDKAMGRPEPSRAKAEEVFELLTGRKPTQGYVKEHQIAPKKVLDLTHLGERPKWYEVAEELTKAEGSISPGQKGGKINEDRFEWIADAFIYKKMPNDPTDETFPVWKLMRNAGPTDSSGAKFYNWLREHGYDAVRYAEQGTNHYAVLKQVPGKLPEMTPELRKQLQERLLVIGSMPHREVAKDYLEFQAYEELKELAVANRLPIMGDKESLIDIILHYANRAAVNVLNKPSW